MVALVAGWLLSLQFGHVGKAIFIPRVDVLTDKRKENTHEVVKQISPFAISAHTSITSSDFHDGCPPCFFQ